MPSVDIERRNDGRFVLKTSLAGAELLHFPLANKGSAFSEEERRTFHLEGLLPSRVTDLDEQVRRAYRSVSRKTDPLERYIGLRSLQDRNETLFYRLLLTHLEELMPIVYTPTVGEGCRSFSRILRHTRGVWITPRNADRMVEVLEHGARDQEVRLIVVTDNERILGLGDQGAGGIGIPIGKLALYTAAAGIHPSATLPVSLDVGTDNEELLSDDLYVGVPQKRLRGEGYRELVDRFVNAVKTRYPNAILQWEDFKKQNAFDLLDEYRDVLPSFNDDIQGTAAVALAAVLKAAKRSGIPLQEQRIVILGAGAAGIGIARQIRDAIRGTGVDPQTVTTSVAVLDRKGLLIADGSAREAYKNELAWPLDLAKEFGLAEESARDLAGVVSKLRPTVLIGTTGQPGAFPEAVVREMARHQKHPAIFPFSNPTSKSEAKAVDLIEWTEGRALIATGSPFDPVTYEGREIPIAQGNNVYIFPGVGLGVLVSGARKVTDAMFTRAAAALADFEDDEPAGLFPSIAKLRPITEKVACAVVREARDSGLGKQIADEEIPTAVAAEMWHPEYPLIEPCS